MTQHALLILFKFYFVGWFFFLFPFVLKLLLIFYFQWSYTHTHTCAFKHRTWRCIFENAAKSSLPPTQQQQKLQQITIYIYGLLLILNLVVEGCSNNNSNKYNYSYILNNNKRLSFSLHSPLSHPHFRLALLHLPFAPTRWQCVENLIDWSIIATCLSSFGFVKRFLVHAQL